MRITSLAALFTKNRNMLPHASADLRDAIHLPEFKELTAEQRGFVSGGPQVQNDPQPG